MDAIKYGDPFVLAVTEGNLDNSMNSVDLNGIEPLENEDILVQGMKDDCREHGGAELLYVCIPIGRVWAADYNSEDSREGPYEDVRTELAETTFERMARAAISVGGVK